MRSGPERLLTDDYLDRFGKTGRLLGLGPAAIHEVEVALHKDAVTTGLIPRAARQIRVTTAKGF